MGGTQSYISSETALTVLVVAGAIGVGYTKMGAPSTSTAPSGPAVSPAKGQGTDSSKKAKKKKTQAKGGSASPPGDSSDALSLSASKSQPKLPPPRVVAFPDVIPGHFDAVPVVAEAAESSDQPKPKKTKKKGKGKAAAPAAAEGTPTPPPAISSSIDNLSQTPPDPTTTKSAKRPSQSQQGPKQPLSSSSPSASSRLIRPLQQSTASIDTDGSWTRVVSHKRGKTAASASASTAAAAADADSSQLSAEADPTTSDAVITPSVTGSSSPVAQRRASITSTSTTEEEGSSFLLTANTNTNTSSTRGSGENRRTLAEKLLPKPRKTGVDDMLETSDFPTLSRVMRVQPLPDEKPATGFSWGDYEDVRVVTDGGENDADGEEDGWGVVTSKRPKRTTPQSSSQSHAQKAPETLTKRQRQNAQRRQNEKSVKAEADADRVARLAKHTRELEKARMIEQLTAKGKTPTSGGMTASVDEKGKMVWD